MVDTRKNDPGKNRSGDPPSTDEAALSARLSRLDKQLSHHRKDSDVGKQAGEEAQARASAMAVGLRLSSELVAGILVGALLGWGFDHYLSTSPWGLIVFLLLGFTAGVMNVMRSTGAMAKQSERLKGASPK